MFSLLITLIAIALSAALALATLYALSGNYAGQLAKTQAALLRIQSDQIMGAVQLFRHEHSRYPDTLAELEAGGYLREIPIPNVSQAPLLPVIPEAVAQSVAPQWILPVPGRPVLLLREQVPVRTCSRLNQLLGVEQGLVREHAEAGRAEQCFGSGQPFTYVLTLERDALVADFATLNASALPGQVLTVVAPGAPNPVVAPADTGW